MRVFYCNMCRWLIDRALACRNEWQGFRNRLAHQVSIAFTSDHSSATDFMVVGTATQHWKIHLVAEGDKTRQFYSFIVKINFILTFKNMKTALNARTIISTLTIYSQKRFFLFYCNQIENLSYILIFWFSSFLTMNQN